MPRISIGGNFEDVPLSVAAVSVKIGVPASTLRTWERRYGLGPSARTMGSHRRYTSMDIARLHLMCKLIQEGYSTCDAASRVRAASLNELDLCGSIKASDSTLQDASRDNDIAMTQAIIRKSVSEMGLLKSWEKLIKPALDQLAQDYRPTLIGVASYQFLRQELLKVLNKIVEEAPSEKPELPTVLLVAPLGQECESTVLGAALQWERVPAQQINICETLLAKAVAKSVSSCSPAVVVLVNPSTQQLEETCKLTEQHQIALVAINKKGVSSVVPRATILHSLSAALAEIVAIVD